MSFKLNVKMTKVALQFSCPSCHLTRQRKSVLIQNSQPKAFQQQGTAENTNMF